MRNTAFHPIALRQQGFIQNFLLPGIILLGVALAGISLASGGSTQTITPEQTAMRVNAMRLSAQTVAAAVRRAEAEKALPDTVGDAQSVGLGNLTVGMYLPANQLNLPATVSAVAIPWRYMRSNLTTTADPQLRVDLLLGVLQPAVQAADAQTICQQTNRRILGSDTIPPAGTKPESLPKEGCFADSDLGFVYYLAVNTYSAP